jgi:hypothetical protein
MKNTKLDYRAASDRADRIAKSNPHLPAFYTQKKEEKYPSVEPTTCNTGKAPPKVYTGTYVIGIATMHKSNAVPVTSQEQAIDLANMRRN